MAFRSTTSPHVAHTYCCRSRDLSFACRRLKDTDFDLVAANSLMGTETSPKLMVPDAIACAILSTFAVLTAVDHIIDCVPKRPKRDTLPMATPGPAAGSLDVYDRKRDPARTPEPFATGGVTAAAGGASAGLFVIQQHAARRMHWDLRLEINGALASWAVPKGPSLEPAEKRLAVQTEDHPLEYAGFEGIIPPGNYGAGAMIVWDRGAFRSIDDEPTATGRLRGKIDLELEGQKLHGRWALVRTKGGSGKEWLLIRKGAAVSGPEIVSTQPASILSGLTVEELRGGIDHTAACAQRARAGRAVERQLAVAALRPMLAESAEEPFSDARWLFEVKYDGVRILAERTAQGRASLFSRTGLDISATFPEIVNALVHLPCSEFILDGEVVALDERGRPSFERLQQRLHQSDPGVVARAQ